MTKRRPTPYGMPLITDFAAFHPWRDLVSGSGAAFDLCPRAGASFMSSDPAAFAGDMYRLTLDRNIAVHRVVASNFRVPASDIEAGTIPHKRRHGEKRRTLAKAG